MIQNQYFILHLKYKKKSTLCVTTKTHMHLIKYLTEFHVIEDSD